MKCATFVVCAIFSGVLAQQAAATAPSTSLRPVPRFLAHNAQSSSTTALVDSMPVVQIVNTLRPRPRPTRRASDQASLYHTATLVPAVTPVSSAAAISTPVSIVSSSSAAVSRSLRPLKRPISTVPVAPKPVAVRQTPAPVQPSSGKTVKICGNRSIQGYKIVPIQGQLAGCSLANPVRVVSVDGVALSSPTIMDCPTAKALNTWVKTGAKPTIGRLGGGLQSMRVVSGYACRTRNSVPGAKLSEHGKGKAIDISAFTLENGSTITVLTGWPRRVEGKLLRRLHEAACGPFDTVLGPDADRFHKDHFHLDTASNRNGVYCR